MDFLYKQALDKLEMKTYFRMDVDTVYDIILSYLWSIVETHDFTEQP